MIKADLIDSMGTDLTVVNAARVSFDKESDWLWPENGEADLPARDAKLIRYLAKHNHFTPFTHPQITLRESVPIFVARQRFKHVVGFTYNEVSRRYVSDEPEFYVPDVWRKAAENVKQGSGEEPVYQFAMRDEGSGENFWMFPAEAYALQCEASLKLYNGLLAGGVCAEQARMVLPQSMMTSYYVTGSLAAFARAYGLRKDPHAQKEIRDLADLWDTTIRPLFPVSWAALCD